jgi:hypothetical protein
MALFSIRVEVDSFLQLQRAEREALQSIAASLAAIVAKINEPDVEVPPALHEVIEETAASADQVKAAQEQQGP